MRLTAQRVIQPATRAQGINAFHYVHGVDYVWEGAPPPDIRNGVLQASNVLLPPGGNHVLSYLDIVAPDAIPTAAVLRAFAQLYDSGPPPPFRLTLGSCTFESNMVHAYQLRWRDELAQLYKAAIAVRVSVM